MVLGGCSVINQRKRARDVIAKHGPLTREQFAFLMGCDWYQAGKLLGSLREADSIVYLRDSVSGVYRMAFEGEVVAHPRANKPAPQPEFASASIVANAIAQRSTLSTCWSAA